MITLLYYLLYSSCPTLQVQQAKYYGARVGACIPDEDFPKLLRPDEIERVGAAAGKSDAFRAYTTTLFPPSEPAPAAEARAADEEEAKLETKGSRLGIGEISTLDPGIGHANMDRTVGMGAGAEGGAGPAVATENAENEDAPVAVAEVPYTGAAEAGGGSAGTRVGVSALSSSGHRDRVCEGAAKDQVEAATLAAGARGIAGEGGPSRPSMKGRQGQGNNVISGANETTRGVPTPRVSVLGTLFARVAEMGRTMITGGAAAPGRGASRPRPVEFAEPYNMSASGAVQQRDVGAGGNKQRKKKRARACAVIREDPEGSTVAGRLMKRRRGLRGNTHAAATTSGRGGTSTTGRTGLPTATQAGESPGAAAGGAAGRAAGMGVGAVGENGMGRCLRAAGVEGGNEEGPVDADVRSGRVRFAEVGVNGPHDDRVRGVDVEMEDRVRATQEIIILVRVCIHVRRGCASLLP